MEDIGEESKTIIEITSVLKILSEPNRMRIFNNIIEGIQCNCDLGSALQLAPNLVSHHLSVLRDGGLIEMERDPMDARWIYYSVNTKTLAELKTFFDTFFDPRRVKPRLSACGPSLVGEQMPEVPPLRN